MLFTFASISFAEQSANLTEFNSDIEKIEKLIDSDVGLAHQQLLVYQKYLEGFTVKQRIIYHNLLTEIHVLKAKYHLAKTTANKGLSLTKQLSSPSILITEILYNRGFAYESTGDLKLATQDYESGLEIAESFHDKVLIATGLINLGAIYYQTDRYESSLTVLNDAYNIAMQTTDKELKGAVNSELGILYSYIGSSDQAKNYYQQAYEHYKKAGKTILSLNAMVNIGSNHLENENYEQAIVAFKTVLKESDGVRQNEIMYNSYSGLVWANLKKEPANHKASYQYLLRAKEYVSGIERHDIELSFATNEAHVLYKLKRFNEALVSIAKIENILAKPQSLMSIERYLQTHIVHLKAKVFFELGYFQQAYQLQEKRLSLTKILLDREHTHKIAEVRLALEATQADIHKKVLENKRSLQEVELKEVENQQQQQRYHVIIVSLVALIFAWMLVKLAQGQRRLYKAVSIDMLTGVANHRSMIKLGTQLFNHAKLKKIDFSVLLIDVDNLKNINDEFGHEVGDRVLQHIARMGMHAMRKTDVLGRCEGEEFMVFVPNTPLAQAVSIAERLRASVKHFEWQSELSIKQSFSITLSIGIACYCSKTSKSTMDLLSLMRDADSRLYQAKSQGRDRVISL